MSSVDDRIVNMQFNNRQFSAGVTDSQRSLQSLEAQLAKTGSSQGLGAMADSVEQTTSRFGALKIAGVAAIATIASKATSIGLNMVKSLTLDPITSGFAEYQTNLNSIQTIMANTGANVQTVNKYLNQLNHYSDKTIYNFSQMASAIGKFTAAGVSLPDATDAIRGMANSAALSGASVEQLNSAMYQMSQALAAGTIHLMDWNSLVNANMGGQNMQKSLEATAMTMKDNGKAMIDATTTAGNFRDSLQAGWLSADIFNKTMKVMGGQTDKAGNIVAYTTDQLIKMGYQKDAAKRLHEISDAAIHSAQDIKTLPQLFDVIREAIGSGWGRIFQDLFGNFEQSKKMWTSVGMQIQTVIGNIFGSVDKMLRGWRKLGGYQELWAGFGNIFKALGNLIHPFVAAFDAITPGASKAGSTLFTLTDIFYKFTEVLVHVTEGVDYLTPGFVAFGKIIGVVFRGFQQLTSAAGPLAPIFDKLSQSLGNMIQQGSRIAGDLLQGIVSGLSGNDVVAAVMHFAQGIIDTVKNVLGIHSPSTVMMEIGSNVIEGIVIGITKGIPLIFKGIGLLAGAVVDGFHSLFSGVDSFEFVSLLNALLTTGLLLMTRKIIQFVDTWQGWGNNMQKIFDGIGDSLKAWQNSLKAKMIMEIAVAIGILVLSLVALSMLKPKEIATGMGALTAMMGLLSGTLLALSKIQSDVQMGVLATSLLLISAAMIQFSAAIVILGHQDMETLAKGIGAIAAVMGIMIASVRGMAGLKGQFVAASAGMVLMATAINIMAAAIAILGSMNLSTLGKGIGAMAIGLAIMTAALAVMSVGGKSMLAGAAGMVLMAGAINIMTGAIALLGHLSMKTLAKGIGAMALGLTLMTAALAVLSAGGPSMLAGAAGMVLLATAMNMMVGVILVLGSAPFGTVAKGIGLVALALGVLIAAGFLAEAAAPGLTALGVAVLALGAGMFLAGAGMAAFGTGFALLAATGAAGTAVLIGVIHALLAILPEIAVQAAAAFIAFLKVVANAAEEIRPIIGKMITTILGVINDNVPKIVHTAVLFITELLKGIRQLIPQFGKLISTLIKTGLDIITKAVPQYINAGVTIVTKVLEGMAKNIPKMLNAAGDLIARFIKGLGDQAKKIVDAAGRTILKFLDGVDQAVQKYSDQITQKGVDIGFHIVQGVVKGLTSADAVQMLKDAAVHLGTGTVNAIKGFFHIGSPAKTMIPLGRFIVMGLAKGISDNIGLAIAAVLNLATKVISEGNKAIAKANREAQKVQTRAYAAQARADLKADRARDAAKFARQHKKDKEAQKRAKLAQKQADAAQKHADKVQHASDRAQQHVQNVQAFQQADLHGKGDIRDQQATDLADKANKQLQKANAEAAEARELMKTNRKAGRAMLEQAKKDAKQAAELAKKARQAHKDAQQFYAKEVNERIKQLESDAAADAQAKKDQAAYDSADAAGKSAILTQRADAAEKRAEAQKKLSEQLMKQAKKLAHTDAAKAMRLLDRAEKAAQASQDAADQAAQDRDQAQQVLSEGSDGTGGTVDTLAPSRTVLEDAAKAVDRYTQSLLQAQEAAAAQQPVVQFVQNNNSPEALSPSEVYRQTNNLLSLAELKMGANS